MLLIEQTHRDTGIGGTSDMDDEHTAAAAQGCHRDMPRGNAG